MVMVTHRLREARVAASYVVMLEAGRVVEAGEATLIMGDASQERTRVFLRAGEEESERGG
jgi:ABC-type histidine transport system ATPase subunit